MSLDDVEVWIVDSSALIEIKTIVSVNEQWEAFKLFEQMAVDGRIALPRQVINEVRKATHPDVPGAWAASVRKNLQRPLDAGYDYLAEVMAVAGDIVDVNRPGEDADPWVVAMALRLRDEGLAVCVVTKDYVDRTSISIATACERFNLDWRHVRDFLSHCGIPLLKESHI